MRLAALLLFASVLHACILPLPGETLHAVPEQAAAALGPGTATRADVLLRLGEPTWRNDGDTHFVYEWETLHGGIVLGFPLPFGGAFEVSCHCLGIRFRPDGLVAERRHFDGGVHSLVYPGADTKASTCERDAALRSRVTEWLSAPSPERR